MPLTDTAIRNAKSDGKSRRKLSDGGGLQLWIMPTGSKLWNLAYRVNGKQKRIAIGPYPTVTLKMAREKREEAKRKIIDGVDPSEERRQKKIAAVIDQSNTFAAIADEVLGKKRREGRAPATLKKLEWLADFIRPSLGARPIAEITAPEALAFLRTVEARGKLETATRLRGFMGEIFRYAIATGRATIDPTTALRGALAAPRATPRAAILEPKPFGALLRAIDGYDGLPEVRIALQLLALTFTRPGELRLARWPEFDFERAIWTIPETRMKMRREHRVPLAPQTLALLQSLKQFTGNYPYILPGAFDPNRPLSENTLNKALRKLGYRHEAMTAHGFRSSASTMLNESSLWNRDAIEAQLAHLDPNTVRRAYARAEYWEERVRMMAWWGERLDAMRSSLQSAT